MPLPVIVAGLGLYEVAVAGAATTAAIGAVYALTPEGQRAQAELYTAVGAGISATGSAVWNSLMDTVVIHDPMGTWQSLTSSVTSGVMGITHLFACTPPPLSSSDGLYSDIERSDKTTKRIKITQQMANAINQYAGIRIIDETEIGRDFFAGNAGDGEIGIDVESIYSPGFTRNLGQFFSTDGQVKYLYFEYETDPNNKEQLDVTRYRKLMTLEGIETVEIPRPDFKPIIAQFECVKGPLGMQKCDWDITGAVGKDIGREKAIVIIGALFGEAETGMDLIDAQKAQIAGLKKAMGI